ncbi:MAG: 3-hydroxyacyl-CoA dehydrogenase NAD-binding domain-containing protein, partial [Methylococcales bacterium]
MNHINSVAVIGAGVMGAGIAAHIANAGVPVLLLDVVPKDNDNRNAIAETVIGKLIKSDPPALMQQSAARLITPGNIEDHLSRLSDVDWVIEAVIENPVIKQSLYRKLEQVCRSDAVISSNTSTLPLALLCKNMPDSFKQRFLISHFFNPPRYMRLLELVAGSDTRPEALQTINTFADLRLGKGCVSCHDTPGFIANRIGTFWIQSGLLQAIALQQPIEHADAVMTLFGIPKTGVFGLLDLVGLDLIPHILGGFKQMLPPQDSFHAINTLPVLMQQMIADGYTGRKGKGGFYRLQKRDDGKRIKEAIDLHTGAYRLSEKVKLTVPNQNYQELLSQDTVNSRYAWQVMSQTLVYSARLVPEIADNIDAIDTAMRLGYNWTYGPFELLDLLGVDWFVQRLAAEQRLIPQLLANRQRFYKTQDGKRCYVDVHSRYTPCPRAAGTL